MSVQVPHSRTERVNLEQRAIREFLAPGEHPRVVQVGGMKPIKGLLGNIGGLAAGGKAGSLGAVAEPADPGKCACARAVCAVALVVT